MKPPVLTDEDKAALGVAKRIATIHAAYARGAAETTDDPKERERLTREADAGCAVMEGVRALLGLGPTATFVDKFGRPMVTYLGIALPREQAEILRRVLLPHAESPTITRVLDALGSGEALS